MSNCAHSWFPISGWNARYRCQWCKAIAYRNLVNGGARGVPARMTVYVCKKCKEPAVQGGKLPQLCAEHLAAEQPTP